MVSAVDCRSGWWFASVGGPKIYRSILVSAEPKIERNDDINPYWIEDKELKKGPVAFISPNERAFWVDLIDKYLYPIDNDKAEQVTKIMTIMG